MKSGRTALLAVALVGAHFVTASAAADEDWRPFSATWTLAGKRTFIATEGARRAAVVYASGSFVTTKGDVVGRGFYGEVIGFDDGGNLIVGRAVFTDARGDKVFASLKAQPLGSGRTATATITGGTGRWAGLEGEFAFAWKFVVESGEGDFDAMTLNIEGRARRVPPKSEASAPAEAPK